MDYQVLPSLPDSTREAIHTLLRNYNHAKNPAFFTARELPQNSPLSLNVVAFDASGAVTGGLLAETQFLWLRVSIMAVVESAQKQGIGRKLLEMAEQEAIARNCRYSYLDTMDYQSPEFYQKRGYRVVGKLENWDSNGHTKYLFTKRLAH